MADLRLLPAYRIYREPEEGEQFCIFADPAESRDFCAAVAISKKHCDTPLIYNEVTESSQFGYELNKMATYLHNRTSVWPTIGVERNTGQATIYVLNTLNYPMMFRMVTFDTSVRKESEKVGWLTTEPTRRKMLDDLAQSIRQKVIKIYDKDVLDQLKCFVVKKGGKAEAESGKKDDLVMALAGSYQLYQLVPLYDDEDWSPTDKIDRREHSQWRFR